MRCQSLRVDSGLFRLEILLVIIRQIYSLSCDCPKQVTRPNIFQLKLGNIREYSPIFNTARVAKTIWRIINTIAAIWGEKCWDICMLTVSQTVRFSEQVMSVDKYPGWNIFASNGGMEAIVYLILI